MINTAVEPPIALEVYFERGEEQLNPAQVTAICGYVEKVGPTDGPVREDLDAYVSFLDSSVEFVGSGVVFGEPDTDAHRDNNWHGRNFANRSTADFMTELDGTSSRSRLMIIGTAAVEAFYEAMASREPQDQTTTLLLNATALAVNRLRRSVTSLDPSPAALGDIQHFLRTKANTAWAERDPDEHNATLRQTWDSIGWHVQLQGKKTT